MTKIDDGGSAFPRSAAWSPDRKTVSMPQEGMSLRDWIAAQIAAAIVGDREQWLAFIHDRKGVTPEAHVARESYLMADALLAERSKAGGGQ